LVRATVVEALGLDGLVEPEHHREHPGLEGRDVDLLELRRMGAGGAGRGVARVMGAADFRPALVDRATAAGVEQGAGTEQVSAQFVGEAGERRPMGGGARHDFGEVLGREMPLDVLGGVEDFVGLHVHGHAAAVSAAGPAGDLGAELRRTLRKRAVELRHAPAQGLQHLAGLGGLGHALLHALHRGAEQPVPLSILGWSKG
jgi:hypothetical protein